ncbi:hypothetical protein Thermo_00595 [Thermoplasmatales archaeon]|nr:hypothetical protein Thermo_00595 [Thermoplasmatales archaeon]
MEDLCRKEVKTGLTRLREIWSPIAAIVAAALVASAAVLGLINWMGGYQGVYYADSTNWIASLYGHPPAWIAYNPVPGGY